MKSARPGTRRTMFPLLGIILFVAGTGCRTLPVMAPIDLEAGRWEVAEVPAVWRPRRGAPELTGELLVVRSAAGDRMVQFSKQGLPVVTAQVRSNRWQISSSLRGGVFRGRLPARRAVLWLLIDGCPPSPPPDRRSGWQLSLGAASGRWALTNHQTGEWIEGAVEP